MGAVAGVMFKQPHLIPLLLLCSAGVTLAFPGDGELFGAEQNFPPKLEETDSSCPLMHECISKENCYHYQEDLDQLRNMTVGSEDYEELFSELGQLVCNKKEKGYCCSTVVPNGGVIGGTLRNCCFQCRWNPRRGRCVSKATSRKCLC